MHPRGIDLDSKDNLFVSDRDLRTIQKFTNNGSLIASGGAAGTGPGKFDMPWNVGVDNRDHV